MAIDPVFGRIVAAFGLPAFWHREPGFATLTLLVLEQQVSLASARSTFDRLAERAGGISPDTVLAAGEAGLRASGVTRQKTAYLLGLAGACSSGALDLAALEGLDDDQARAILLALRGIGRWTADVYLLACLGRPDVWPAGDRALRVAAGDHLDSVPPTQEELEVLGERWRPHRSSAARLFWHAYLSERGRSAGIPA